MKTKPLLLNETGFTLIELMVVVAILAILLTVGIPSFRTTIENNKILTINDRLSAVVKLARSEAISRGKTITLCPSANQVSCGGSWSDGWLVYLDDNADRAFDLGTDELLKAENLDEGNYVVNLNSTVTTTLQFSGEGRAPLSATYAVCGPSARNNDARGLVIQRSGATRYSVDADANGVREDHQGNDLSC